MVLGSSVQLLTDALKGPVLLTGTRVLWLAFVAFNFFLIGKSLAVLKRKLSRCIPDGDFSVEPFVLNPFSADLKPWKFQSDSGSKQPNASIRSSELLTLFIATGHPTFSF